MTRRRYGSLVGINLFAAVVFILGACPRMQAGGIKSLSCSGHGFRTPGTLNQCTCLSGYTGPDCSRRLCPTGRAWFDYATASDTAHAEAVCSNMGYCNPNSGICKCRPGFGGPACDRLDCPKDCNGHGKCISMYEAGQKWDGSKLVIPFAPYDNWDAHMIYGCICDAGYKGYDCSLRECPKGDDPLTTGQKNEVLLLECKATSGNFFFTFKGHSTEAITFNQTYGPLTTKFMGMYPAIKQADITMGTGGGVCSQNTPTTTIIFSQNLGPLPAARVTSLDLAVAGDPTAAHLYLVTQTVLTCPVCHRCTGGFFLSFQGVFTSRISATATPAELQAALRQVYTLTDTGSVYGKILVNVTSTGTAICSSTSPVTTNIKLRASYGNLPDFVFVNGVRNGTGTLMSHFNMTTNKGTKENAECSNHGLCDTDTGMCKCFQSPLQGLYSWDSSDGYGNKGLRGDCGYQVRASIACPNKCTFRGTCDPITYTCQCYDGFEGPDCSMVSCPRGPAWFDEPTAYNKAHALGAVCSNRGLCDYKSGTCRCQTGFAGLACEKLDCPYSGDWGYCNGHGRCLSMYRLSQLADPNGDPSSYTYGSEDPGRDHATSTWDALMIHGCHCGTKDTKQPYAGPKTMVSGVVVDNPKIPGFFGYDCSKRWCPTGDDPETLGGLFEVQVVDCSTARSPFTLTFRNQQTTAISTNATALEVAWALGNLSTVGRVNVSFANNHTRACAHNQLVRVTFTTELGELPIMSSSHRNVTVGRAVVGSKEDVECSNRGYCNYDTGVCSCVEGYMSSDGDGNLGLRGDCGARTWWPKYKNKIVLSGGGVS